MISAIKRTTFLRLPLLALQSMLPIQGAPYLQVFGSISCSAFCSSPSQIALCSSFYSYFLTVPPLFFCEKLFFLFREISQFREMLRAKYNTCEICTAIFHTNFVHNKLHAKCAFNVKLNIQKL